MGVETPASMAVTERPLPNSGVGYDERPTEEISETEMKALVSWAC